jgi:hypothetical protein
MDVDRDGFAKNVERGGGSLGRLGCGRRAVRSDTAAQYRRDRGQRAPHPTPARKHVTMTQMIVSQMTVTHVTMTAAIHVQPPDSATWLRCSIAARLKVPLRNAAGASS